MHDAWFAALFLIGALTFGGTLLYFWLAQALRQHREREALNAEDLRSLERSVEALIVRLREASDEAVEEMSRRQEMLQALLERVERRLENAGPGTLDPHEGPDPGFATGREAGVATPDGTVASDVARLAGSGLDGPAIAERTGLTRGEVELMLEVLAARR